MGKSMGRLLDPVARPPWEQKMGHQDIGKRSVGHWSYMFFKFNSETY